VAGITRVVPVELNYFKKIMGLGHWRSSEREVLNELNKRDLRSRTID
jgi:hypothetical protein